MINRLSVLDGDPLTALTDKSMHGDALEALVGAIYLDKGFEATRRFIIQRLLKPHFDLENIVQNNPNHKSLMIEWAQRANKKLHFQILEERGALHNKEFTAQVVIDGQPVATGTGYSKKKAEQAAAAKACELLETKK